MTEEPWPNWASDETSSVHKGITLDKIYTMQIEDFSEVDIKILIGNGEKHTNTNLIFLILKCI